MIVCIDTIASDDGGHRGSGGGGGEDEYIVCMKRYVRWQTGGRRGVCMCTGMTNAMFYGNGDTDEDRYGTG